MAQNIQDVISWLGEQAEAGTTGKKVKNNLYKLVLHILGNGPKKSSSLVMQAISLPEIVMLSERAIWVISEEVVVALRTTIWAYDGGNLVLEYITIEKQDRAQAQD